MYDSVKVIIGLAVFLAVFLSPVAYNFAIGEPVGEPDLTPAKEAAMEKFGAEICVRDREVMMKKHMQILDEWRDLVVRDGVEAPYVSPDNGKKFEMSLTNTCMDCHSNYTTFCNECHTAANVEPFCWDCHLNTRDFGELKRLRGIEE